MGRINSIKKTVRSSSPNEKFLRFKCNLPSEVNTLGLAKQLLSEGLLVRFIGRGYSMFPALKNNDMIILEPFKISRPKIGEIVLLKISSQHYLIHRVIKILLSGEIITKGDALINEDRPVNIKNILARVIRVRRKNREKRLNSASARRIGLFISYLYWCRLLIQARVLKKTIKFPKWLKSIFFKIIYGKEKSKKNNQKDNMLFLARPATGFINNFPTDFNISNTIYQKSKNLIFTQINKTIFDQKDNFILVPIRDNVADLENSYQINKTGLIIWELIDGQKSIEAITEVFSQKCQINLNVAQKDVTGLFKELYKVGLIIKKD